MTGATARLLDRIADIPATQWDALACTPGTPVNPFVLHAFLKALEDSGSVGPETGWRPAHLELTVDGRIAGAAPLYVKTHSYGEYVFDQSWADAFARAGGRYYPKLLSAVPFTPATGPRLLAGGDQSTEDLLALSLQQVAERMRVSSAHLNFVTEALWTRLERFGFLRRTDQQFHWNNNGYARFGDFLTELSSIKRKNLKRERGQALEQGIAIEWITGRDIQERHWDAFYDFYMDTGSRKWGSPYLTRAFFSLVGANMSDHILLIMAKRAGRYIAGALNFIGSDTLYGRNWGAIEHHPFLHFEVCYYQAIDFAIAKGLARVEAGAQGAHKLARGYLPVPTYSLHWIADPGFRTAVARYLEQERAAVAEGIDDLAAHSPFKKTPEDEDTR